MRCLSVIWNIIDFQYLYIFMKNCSTLLLKTLLLQIWKYLFCFYGLNESQIYIGSKIYGAKTIIIIFGFDYTQGEVGLAAIQVSNPVLILCQFSDSPTYPRNGTNIRIWRTGLTWDFVLFTDDIGTVLLVLWRQMQQFSHLFNQSRQRRNTVFLESCLQTSVKK